MATTYTDARSAGGKIATKNRRRFNPYDRPPPPPPPPPPRSPNFFSGVIVPATRKIASGAAKVISSVFDSDSSSSASSSSGDSAYEDDAYIGDDHDISLNEVDELNPETGTSMETKRCMSKEPQLSGEKSERKHVIEQLLMQETFSREECERLVKIINSRVVDHSAIEKGADVVLNNTPGDTIGTDSLDLCNKAVMEARKWVKERKVGPSPVSDFGSCGVYSDRLQHMESEVASPMVMAKSYMNARPPWASPSAEQIELRTPSTMTTQLTRDGKSYSVSGDSCSPSKRWSSLASGSWNIQDEIRRVRSKATEKMLQTLSSPKVDLSSFALSPRTSQEYIVADRVVARTGDKVNVFNSPLGTKPVDGSAELAAGVSTKLGFSAFEIGQDGVVNEASLFNHGTYVPEQKQDSEAIQIEGDYAAPKSHHSNSPDHTAEHYADPNLSSRNGSDEKEVKEHAETENANGLPSSQASLSAGGITDEIHRHLGEVKDTSAWLNLEKSSHGVPMEDKCTFLSEASVEVPIAYETGSQNSHEELSQGRNQPEATLDLAGNPDGMAVKQRGKKPGKSSKRGRGRGK